MGQDKSKGGARRPKFVIKSVLVQGKPVSFHGPLPAEHPIYSLIGQVAAEWATLEHVLDAIIWELLSVDREEGSCVTGQMTGHAPRFRAVIALCRLRGIDRSLIQAAEDLMQKTFGVAEQRNRIVHDAWYEEKLAGSPSQFRNFSWKGVQGGQHEVDPEEVRATIERIKRRTDAARDLAVKISFADTTWKGKRPTPPVP